jgi:hypothetical protein
MPRTPTICSSWVLREPAAPLPRGAGVTTGVAPGSLRRFVKSANSLVHSSECHSSSSARRTHASGGIRPRSI